MTSIVFRTLSISLMCLVSFSYAHATQPAQTKSKTPNTETQLQIKVCNKKKQGDWVSYPYKGVIFNGSCQPNQHGKLQFTPPSPNNPT